MRIAALAAVLFFSLTGCGESEGADPLAQEKADPDSIAVGQVRVVLAQEMPQTAFYLEGERQTDSRSCRINEGLTLKVVSELSKDDVPWYIVESLYHFGGGSACELGDRIAVSRSDLIAKTMGLVQPPQSVGGAIDDQFNIQGLYDLPVVGPVSFATSEGYVQLEPGVDTCKAKSSPAGDPSFKVLYYYPLRDEVIVEQVGGRGWIFESGDISCPEGVWLAIPGSLFSHFLAL